MLLKSVIFAIETQNQLSEDTPLFADWQEVFQKILSVPKLPGSWMRGRFGVAESSVFWQPLEFVLMPAVADHFGLQNAVRLGRMLLVLGRAMLQIAENFHAIDDAAERGVAAIQMRC